MRYRLGVRWVSWPGTGLMCLVLGALPFAGGPRSVLNNQVLKWNLNNPDTFPVRFIIDNGPLGGLTREQGAVLVRQAFQKWVDVLTSRIQFADQGFLDMDLTGDNFQSFFKEEVRPQNPVVFDDDGKIIDDVLAVGSSDTVLGFAGERFINTSTGEFLSGWIVLNGLQASQVGLFPRVIIHEIGHLVGLDHTQINNQLAFNSNSSDDVFVPLMFPLALSNGPDKPIRDDIAWVSWLYPASHFQTSTATIKGRVFRRTGGAFQGANVVAVQVSVDGLGAVEESQQEIVSVVSDFLLGNDGSYEIPGLTPGDYAVFIEPLNPLFVQGSSVGPFDTRFTNFVKDYYNGANESGDEQDDPVEKMVIRLGTGQAAEKIDLIANEPARLLSDLIDDDEVSYEFPEGFLFPFFSNTYAEVFVNSDGNLTFGKGDGGSGDRDESRFLSGPPRIAPLFTDLDPGKAGEVTGSADTQRVTFTWDKVPEFSSEGDRPGNQFSVTLFSSGDILFQYQNIEITPDGSLLALVGISPGNLSGASPVDLSLQESLVSVSGDPVYEVFQGSTFDLTGQFIFFRVSSNNLYFPFYSGDEQNLSGYAVANLSSGTAQLVVEARGSDGSLLFPEDSANPSSQAIAPQQQLAKVGREFFGVGFDVAQSGWIRMISNAPELGSFFLFGNGLSGPITRMDGALAFTEQSQVLFFTRLYDGPSAFQTFLGSAFQDATTSLAIANPNNEAISLTLTLFSNTGQPVAPQVTRVLPALGRLFETVRGLFNISSPISDGYVRVDVEGPGAVGFELIELQDTLLGLNASFENDQSTLYSAYLASGIEAGNSVFTSLKVVNTSNDLRAVTITAFRPDGTILNLIGPLILGPGSNVTLQRTVSDLFALGSPVNSLLTTGSIRIEADGPGVIGDVILGDSAATGIPNQVDFAAAWPLQTKLFTEAVFSHVVNGSTDPKDPSKGFFTGIALFNPNTENAQITIKVFDGKGILAGQTESITLEQNQQLSDVIENLIPETADLIGGYIVIESTQTLVAQVIFANNTLQFFAAVPPTILK